MVPNHGIAKVVLVIGQIDRNEKVRAKSESEIVQHEIGNVVRDRSCERMIVKQSEAKIVDQVVSEDMGFTDGKVSDKAVQRTAETAQQPAQAADGSDFAHAGVAGIVSRPAHK